MVAETSLAPTSSGGGDDAIARLICSMTTPLTFSIPAKAATEIGALRPDFAAKLAHLEDPRFSCRVDDAWCRIECSRDVALTIAAALQARVRNPATALDVAVACADGTSAIFTLIRRADNERARRGPDLRES
jgi:hypothetical protein